MSHWFAYPNIDPIAIHLGPISIHWYGLSYLFGFICVFLWMNRPAGRRRLGLTTEQIQDFLVYALVGVLIGGRTGFVIADVLTHNNFVGEYLQHPLNFIAIWNGGMAFHGALIGVILALVLFLRKHPGLTFGMLGDEVVVLLPLGLFTTRLVNFINDELPGKICDPDHPYCILFPNYLPSYRYPSQIFESILDIAVLPFVLYIYSRKPANGVVAWSWFTLYGVTRFVAEIWREPGFTVIGLDGGQFVALLQIFVGIGFLVYSVRGVYTERGTQTDAR